MKLNRNPQTLTLLGVVGFLFLVMGIVGAVTPTTLARVIASLMQIFVGMYFCGTVLYAILTKP
jgi:hypothetical protein